MNVADANLKDFYDRVRRFERMRSDGFGFETSGTIGRSFYRRPRKAGIGWLGRLIRIAAYALVLKALLYLAVGATVYSERVDRLRAGEGLDPLGGWIMQADPVTQAIADLMKAALALVP